MMAVNYRPTEAIYIRALADRVTVIFSTTFKDETDKIYGKVFLQVGLIDPGIRRCTSPASHPERPASALHQQGATTRAARVPRPRRFRRHWLRDIRAVPAPLSRRSSKRMHQPYPALPRLSALSHQGVKGIHALAHAVACPRLSQSA